MGGNPTFQPTEAAAVCSHMLDNEINLDSIIQYTITSRPLAITVAISIFNMIRGLSGADEA